MESNTNLTSHVNSTRVLISPNLTIPSKKWRNGKYAIAICVLTVLAVLIFVAVGAIILFNTMKVGSEEIDKNGVSEVEQVSEIQKVPESPENSNPINFDLQNIDNEKDSEHSINSDSEHSASSSFTNFQLSRLQTLKFCQATSFTSFTSHLKKFLIIAEKETNMVKILQFSESKQEFITVQIIIIHKPLELKYLPELFSPENKLLMIVSAREVTFYKYLEKLHKTHLNDSLREASHEQIYDC